MKTQDGIFYLLVSIVFMLAAIFWQLVGDKSWIEVAKGRSFIGLVCAIIFGGIGFLTHWRA